MKGHETWVALAAGGAFRIVFDSLQVRCRGGARFYAFTRLGWVHGRTRHATGRGGWGGDLTMKGMKGMNWGGAGGEWDLTMKDMKGHGTGVALVGWR